MDMCCGSSASVQLHDEKQQCMKALKRLKSITEFHRSRGLPPPEHPLISVVDYATVSLSPGNNDTNWVFDFYSISLKRNLNAKYKYGQQEYDFDEGVMFFIAPGQVFGIEVPTQEQVEKSGWILLVHPDFLLNTTLAKSIRQYEFFNYFTNEALFLSIKEETAIDHIIANIRQEYHSNIDKFSQKIIVSQIDALLSYSERFYQRQFITRNASNHKILDRLEEILNRYFSDGSPLDAIPTVQRIAEALNVSHSYLTGLVKTLTGQNVQQHIHTKLIEQAKEKLSTTDLSVGEIAYALGFEHPQSFSRFFKTKTNLSPVQFRQSFN
jgi:AraC family transcriptional regulator, transcriptional activator of pobA